MEDGRFHQVTLVFLRDILEIIGLAHQSKPWQRLLAPSVCFLLLETGPLISYLADSDQRKGLLSLGFLPASSATCTTQEQPTCFFSCSHRDQRPAAPPARVQKMVKTSQDYRNGWWISHALGEGRIQKPSGLEA